MALYNKQQFIVKTELDKQNAHCMYNILAETTKFWKAQYQQDVIIKDKFVITICRLFLNIYKTYMTKIDGKYFILLEFLVSQSGVSAILLFNVLQSK